MSPVLVLDSEGSFARFVGGVLAAAQADSSHLALELLSAAYPNVHVSTI